MHLFGRLLGPALNGAKREVQASQQRVLVIPFTHNLKIAVRLVVACTVPGSHNSCEELHRHIPNWDSNRNHDRAVQNEGERVLSGFVALDLAVSNGSKLRILVRCAKVPGGTAEALGVSDMPSGAAC
mgnify:CR=1 FL=1